MAVITIYTEINGRHRIARYFILRKSQTQRNEAPGHLEFLLKLKLVCFSPCFSRRLSLLLFARYQEAQHSATWKRSITHFRPYSTALEHSPMLDRRLATPISRARTNAGDRDLRRGRRHPGESERIEEERKVTRQVKGKKKG